MLPDEGKLVVSGPGAEVGGKVIVVSSGSGPRGAVA